MYDSWQLGIDGDGYLIKKVEGKWEKDVTVNVYPDPSDKTSSHKNPLSKLLKWKYDRFVVRRENIFTRLVNGMRSIYVSPTK
jgi:hypothetical protein